MVYNCETLCCLAKYISQLFSASNIDDVNILKQSRKENQTLDLQFVLRTLDIEKEMKDCLMFFNNIGFDISVAYTEIKKIADTFSEMDRHYESDLLSTAVGLLKSLNTTELKTEYVSMKTLGRKMIFTSYRAKGIALIENDGQKHYLRYVFDVSDTNSRQGYEAPIWNVKQRDYFDIIDSLEDSFGELADKTDFISAVKSAATNLVEDNYIEYFPDIESYKTSTYFENLDSNETERTKDVSLKKSAR